MKTILFLLIISNSFGFYPKVNGMRYSDPLIETTYPYTLGISAPYWTDIVVTHDNVVVFDDYVQGEIEMGIISDGIIRMEGGGKSYRIVPEVASIIFGLTGVLLCRKMKGFRK